jgi:two-component system, OmpR family, sensor histidine kinase CreC
MKLGLRLLLAFFAITGLTAFFVLRVFLAEVKPSVREVMEDIMVDTANLLAELAADELAALSEGGTLEGGRFAQRVHDYATRPIDARIWGLHKQTLDFRIYVTDVRGRVVLDSGATPALNQDYSRWRDVALTLRGEYGARATREVRSDERSAIMYVAAPVRAQGRTVGVLTVAKPLATVQQFIDRAEKRIVLAGFSLLLLSLTVGVAVTGWLVWSVRRLRAYALQVRAGERLAAPRLSGELGELAQAMDAMRERLEGREHIEHTVRAMTHELKSPLAAIRGAAELLGEELPSDDRQRFAAQVTEQSERLRLLVDRLLELSKLESLRGIEHPQRIALRTLLQRALDAAAARIEQRRLTLRWLAEEDVQVQGDEERLQLALSNVLGNAIDFAPPGSTLELAVQRVGGEAQCSVRDHGPGVADYALPQLGARFFSTPRPDGEHKGTGLGLAIAKQVAALHGGRMVFEACEPGLRVTLQLPAA